VSVVAAVGGVGAGATAPASTGVIFMDVSCLVPVGAVESPAQQASDEEEDAVDDGEDPASLEHCAGLVERSTPAGSTRIVVITDLDSNGDAQVRAIGIRDSLVKDNTSDEGAHERDIDNSDEGAGHAAESVELIQSDNRPSAGEDGDDE